MGGMVLGGMQQIMEELQRQMHQQRILEGGAQDGEAEDEQAFLDPRQMGRRCDV